MADAQPIVPADKPWQQSVDEARAMARERFKERLENGEPVGNCSCHTEHEAVTALGGDAASVVGVRFRDSSRIYFYGTESELTVGEWVVVTSSRGLEPARVVVGTRQMLLNQIDGELRPIERVLTESDVAAMESRRDKQAEIVRRGGTLSRENNFRVKVLAAEYNFDGSRIKVSYSTDDKHHTHVHDLKGLLEFEYGVIVDMAQAGPRDEARLIGGLGKCGRTLCCSSWLPYYPDTSMGMAKNQDLSLNPSKVSGLCGRLLCCLSYENEQYRQAKRILPRLGTPVNTPDGQGMVISLQVLKELVTVRLESPNEVRTYAAADVLGDPDQRRYEGGDSRAEADQRRKRRGRRPQSED